MKSDSLACIAKSVSSRAQSVPIGIPTYTTAIGILVYTIEKLMYIFVIEMWLQLLSTLMCIHFYTMAETFDLSLYFASMS